MFVFDETMRWILAARGDDLDNWMNLLVLVVMGAIALVGKFLQSVGHKSGEEQAQTRRPPQAGPMARRPGPVSEGMQKPKTPAPQARKPARPGPTPAWKPRLPQAGPALGEAEPASQPLAGIQAGATSLGDLSQEVAALPTTGMASTQEQQQQAVSQRRRTLQIADLHDSDNLKKAVLYREILGKPLALRDPAQWPGAV